MNDPVYMLLLCFSKRTNSTYSYRAIRQC